MTQPPGLGDDPKKPSFEIRSEDLYAPSVEQNVQQMRQAQTPQLVRSVGAPTAGGGLPQAVVTLAIAGVVGGLLGWVVSELLSQTYALEGAFRDCLGGFSYGGSVPDACNYEPWYGSSAVTSSIMFFGSYAVILGVVIAGWEGIATKSLPKFQSLVLKVLPALVGVGIVGSFLGQKFYESALENSDGSDPHFERGVAWAISAAGIGAALGLVSKSNKRAINGALGGAIGGFLGGFVFDFIELSDSNGVPNRIVGLTITGVAVGAAIGLVETARREHWLEIVSGGMAGKQFILYSDPTTVGSGHDCSITLIKDPGIAPLHVTLHRRGEGLAVRPDGGAVAVNGAPVSEAVLVDGDLLQMGTTTVRYRSKQAVMPTGSPFAPPAPSWPQNPGGFPGAPPPAPGGYAPPAPPGGFAPPAPPPPPAPGPPSWPAPPSS